MISNEKQEKTTEKKTENGSLRWSVKACIWTERGKYGNELALKIGDRTGAYGDNNINDIN